MDETTPVADVPTLLLDSSAYLLSRIGRLAKSDATAHCTQVGMDLAHVGVLALLEERGSTTQAAIADAIGMDRSQLVGELDELEALGWIERRRDPQDRRRQLVSLTRAGRKQIASFRTVAAEIEDDFLAPLDPKQRKALHELLLTLAKHHDRRFSAELVAS